MKLKFTLYWMYPFLHNKTHHYTKNRNKGIMHNMKLQKSNNHLFLAFIYFGNSLYDKCWEYNVEYLNQKSSESCSFFFPYCISAQITHFNTVLPCSQHFTRTRRITESISFQRYYSKGHIYKGRSDANNIAVKKTRYQKMPEEQEQEYQWQWTWRGKVSCINWVYLSTFTVYFS